MGELKALGSTTNYTDKYDKTLLEEFPRTPRRKSLTAPMNGADIWTAFEVSFLQPNGLPCFLVLRISNPADSKNIFESKSLKLYLNSFNNTIVEDKNTLLDIISRDLTSIAEGFVEVIEVDFFREPCLYFDARKLESFVKDLVISEYEYNPKLLRTKEIKFGRVGIVELYSDLLRSNCEITNQPDWGRVYISYEPGGREVTYESLLEYIISIRTHQAFHEPTCEMIYNDLFELLKPKKLLVLCQYTRRGGIDINPIRYTHRELAPEYLVHLPKLIQQ